MKRTLTLATLLLLLAGTAVAQDRKAETFKSFWSRFRNAVARSDREAVASMTKLPFLFDGRELNRDEFIASYSRIFDRKVRRCFKKAKTVRDEHSYMVFCGESIYLFSEVGGRYMFTEIGVND